MKRGVHVDQDLITNTTHPLTFSTGGGNQTGSQTLGFWNAEFNRLQQVYLLPDCPMALSIGQLCNDGFSFVWPSNALPFLVPPDSCLTHAVDGPIVEAHRISHHVPIFRFPVEFVPGMPGVSGGGDVASVEPEGAPSAEHPIAPDDAQDDDLEDINPENHAEHCLTHLPKSRHCPVCIQAKLYETPHRRKASQGEVLQDIREVEDPTGPLQRIVCQETVQDWGVKHVHSS